MAGLLGALPAPPPVAYLVPEVPAFSSHLSSSRAKRLAGEEVHDGIDRPVQWKASPADLRNNRELPAGAELQGRLIVRRVQPDNGSKPFVVALFSTVPIEASAAMELAGKRWNIETDLRTLKASLHLDQIAATTDAMVTKEIVLGVAAYNVVRGMICMAARESGVPPRRYGFMKVHRVVTTFGAMMANASSEAEAQRAFSTMLHYIDQARRPVRKRSSYSREVWSRGAKFPTRRQGLPPS